MKKRLSILLLTIVSALHAQEVLLERDPAADTTQETYGPNRRNFVQGFIGGGTVVGPKNTGARLKPLGNYNLVYGLRYKLRFSDYYAIGFEGSVSNLTCNMRQEAGKFLPDTVMHKKQRLNWMFLNIGFFNRINFSKRGNIIGNYIDLGIMGSYCPSFVHFTMDRTDDGRTLRTRERGLDYFTIYNYAVFARVGFNRTAIMASYRMSSLFKSQYAYPNIAPVSITVEISMY